MQERWGPTPSKFATSPNVCSTLPREAQGITKLASGSNAFIVRSSGKPREDHGHLSAAVTSTPPGSYSVMTTFMSATIAASYHVPVMPLSSSTESDPQLHSSTREEVKRE